MACWNTGESRDGNFIRESLWSVPPNMELPYPIFYYILEPKNSQPHTTHTNKHSMSNSVASFYCSPRHHILLFPCSTSLRFISGLDPCLRNSRVINIDERRDATFIPVWPVRSFDRVSNGLSRIVMGVATSIPGGSRGVMKWKSFPSHFILIHLKLQ